VIAASSRNSFTTAWNVEVGATIVAISIPPKLWVPRPSRVFCGRVGILTFVPV
jgi:hypothetical protein